MANSALENKYWELDDELIHHLDRILNAYKGDENVEGYKRLTKQKGFTHSTSVNKEVSEVLESSNSFYLWYGEKVEASPEGYAKIVDLYNDYRQYMEDNGERNIMGRRKFTTELKGKKVTLLIKKIQGKAVRIASGITLGTVGMQGGVKF